MYFWLPGFYCIVLKKIQEEEGHGEEYGDNFYLFQNSALFFTVNFHKGEKYKIGGG